MEDKELKSFSHFNIDDRLLKAVAKKGWLKPTDVQNKVIPVALQGKDVIIRAKTGSGKTGAYLLPILQKILKQEKSQEIPKKVSVILVPSKELCKQAYINALELTAYCSKFINVLDIGNSTVQSLASLVQNADILVGTPSKIVACINNKNIDTKASLECLVIDEADMMLSYGYENDLNIITQHLPKIYQALLVSATISSDINYLKGLILHNPVILKWEESDILEDEKLSQYVIKCEANDKYLLVYALFKLNLVRGKTLIFVNSIDKCYSLKLFFEQFHIKTCILNSELPQNSRVHIVDEFNKGKYDTVIATDEAIKIDIEKKKKKGKISDNEYNVSRGIDFQDVDNIVNLDFPVNPDAYIHRVGRTARGGNRGTALSFVSSQEEQKYLKAVEERLSFNSKSNGTILKPYNFKVKEIEGLRYRVNDAYSNITKIKIKNARLKEIRGEIFNSTKLKNYFQDNPNDLKVLKHDKILAPTEQQTHMKNIPDYLVPSALKNVMLKPKRKRKQQTNSHEKSKKRKVNDDPLKVFKNVKKSK